MVDVRLSDLDAATSVNGAQEFEVNDANASKKVTASQILTYVDNNLTYVSSESDPVVGAVTGIVKADGAGNISAAISGTDYAAAAHTHELDELDATAITDGYVLTADGTGNAVWEAPSAGLTIEYFDCYESTATNVNAGAVVPFNQTRQNSNGAIFSLASGVVTINQAGLYLFQFQITTTITSGTARSGSYAWLEQNTGGGFSAVPGSYQYMYNRILNTGESTGSTSLILNVTSGYNYRVYCQRYVGTDTVTTRANSSRLTIMKIA